MTRRTTLAADHDDLTLLEEEARRRGTSLAQVLREIVAREADSLRKARRPRFGVVAADVSAAQMSVDDEDAPFRESRLRS
jgi:hypothetical protein